MLPSLPKIVRAITSESKVARVVQQKARAGMQAIKATAKRKISAEGINAKENLRRKLSLLERAQNTSTKTKVLPDKRIRYYDKVRPAMTPGKTSGASKVTEFNPLTGKVRTWNECYDHAGRINRVHPKNIDGQIVRSPHYPPTAKERIP